MARINSIALWNLPKGISEGKLWEEILGVWPSSLGEQATRRHIVVRVFKPKGVQQKAVVTGFLASLKKLQEEGHGKLIGGRNLCFGSDYGDPRDEYGDFTVKRDHQAIRDQSYMEGASFRKFDMIFSPHILKQLNPRVFNSLTKKVWLNSSVIPRPANLKVGEDIKRIFQDHNKNKTVLYFHSALGLMQTMMTKNINLNVCSPPLEFTNESGTEFSTICIPAGLGLEASPILRLKHVAVQNGGHIPFHLINSTLLDNEIIATGFTSKCWKCAANGVESSYDLIGISIDLTFIAGTCRSLYIDSEQEFENNAYHWPDEKFTRLVLGGEHLTTQQNVIPLGIMHSPMNKFYNDAMEYKKIVLPILQEEWNTIEDRFRVEYSTHGKIKSSFFLEQILLDSKRMEQPRDVFAVEVLIRKSSAWCLENSTCVNKAMVDMEVETRPMVSIHYLAHQRIFIGRSQVEARILNMMEDMYDTHKLLVQMQIYCEVGTKPIVDEYMMIYAKPDNAEYNTIEKIVNKWTNQENIDINEPGRLKIPIHPLLKFVLDPTVPEYWTLSSSTMKIMKEGNRPGCERIKSLLNKQQMQAMDNAQKYGISFIQGPPGTGKTFTASSIITSLACIENGKIFVTTPSNESADRCAEMIQDVIQKYELDLKIVRMLTRSREKGYRMSNLPSFTREALKNEIVPTLHTLVQKSPLWLRTLHIVDIYQKMKNEGIYKLTKGEWEDYEDHIHEVETGILEEMDVVVCTVATLADFRAERLMRSCKISTLVMDEAGQIAQPSSLLLSIVCPDRVVIIGDHLQLQPTILSVFAKTAGLNKSQLEWVASSQPSTNVTSPSLPWTMLVEQYRMAPTIRKFVSAFSYHNNLKDAANILDRQSSLSPNILLSFPDFETNPILIRDVENGEEVRVGTSYNNPREADEIIKIAGDLVFNQVRPSQITILTLYESQKVEIQDKINSSRYKFIKGIAVNNVDAFQGRENSVIILSLVRSKSDVGFLKIPNRLNVAISRAKELLVVVFKKTTFENCKNQSIKSFYNNLVQNGKFI